MKIRPPTWGTTATLTQAGIDRAERMAYVGGGLVVACLVAQVLGAPIPAEAYQAILGLYAGASLSSAGVAAWGARAHASQYQDPAARQTVAPGPFHAGARDPADRPVGEPGEVD